MNNCFQNWKSTFQVQVPNGIDAMEDFDKTTIVDCWIEKKLPISETESTVKLPQSQLLKQQLVLEEKKIQIRNSIVWKPRNILTMKLVCRRRRRCWFSRCRSICKKVWLLNEQFEIIWESFSSPSYLHLQASTSFPPDRIAICNFLRRASSHWLQS